MHSKVNILRSLAGNSALFRFLRCYSSRHSYAFLLLKVTFRINHTDLIVSYCLFVADDYTKQFSAHKDTNKRVDTTITGDP